jgi:hypothetical protein
MSKTGKKPIEDLPQSYGNAMPLRECSICGGPFDIDTEGGAEGYIGILPVAFCPTCKTGILDFADGYQPGFDCPHCQMYIERE